MCFTQARVWLMWISAHSPFLGGIVYPNKHNNKEGFLKTKWGFLSVLFIKGWRKSCIWLQVDIFKSLLWDNYVSYTFLKFLENCQCRTCYLRKHGIKKKKSEKSDRSFTFNLLVYPSAPRYFVVAWMFATTYSLPHFKRKIIYVELCRKWGIN